MKRVYWLVFAHVACGSSGGPENDPRGPDAAVDGGPPAFSCEGGDPDDVAAAVGSPTGVMSTAADAQGLAAVFETLLAETATTGGRRREGIDCSGAKGSEFTCDCSGGGTLVVRTSGTPDTNQALYDYRDCCTADCCYDGCAWVGGTANSRYDQCASLSATVSCPDDAPVEYSYCLEAGGVWYLVEYQAETFAVSGFYDSGSGGNWSVRDAVTEWACSEDGAGGSCADGTNTLTW